MSVVAASLKKKCETSIDSFLAAKSLPVRIALENGLVVFLVKTAIDSALAPCGRAVAVIANAISTGIGRFMVFAPLVRNPLALLQSRGLVQMRQVSRHNMSRWSEAKPR